MALLGNDLGDDFRRDRLDIGPIRHVGIGHDRRRIGIDENDAIALGPQRLAGLGAGIIEFAGLADDDRSGANDHDGRNIGPLGHVVWRAPCRSAFCGIRVLSS